MLQELHEPLGIPFQNDEVVGHERERIIDLVGHAGGQEADGRQPLVLDEHGTDAVLLGQVSSSVITAVLPGLTGRPASRPPSLRPNSPGAGPGQASGARQGQEAFWLDGRGVRGQLLRGRARRLQEKKPCRADFVSC